MTRATHAISAIDDHEPTTEVMGLIEGRTTAGTPGTVSLQHLHALLGTLAPLRAAYAAAAVERLRALPADARRAVLPHVLAEHPPLAREPRVRAIADELGLDADAIADRPDATRWLVRLAGLRAESATDALARAEHALVMLASAVAEMLRWQRETAARLTADAAFGHEEIPEDGLDVLAWALDPSSDELERALGTLSLHARAIVHASRAAALATLAASAPAAIAARAGVPRWWPAPFRDAAFWSRATAESHARSHAARYDDAFARAYVAHVGGEQG